MLSHLHIALQIKLDTLLQVAYPHLATWGWGGGGYEWLSANLSLTSLLEDRNKEFSHQILRVQLVTAVSASLDDTKHCSYSPFQLVKYSPRLLSYVAAKRAL